MPAPPDIYKHDVDFTALALQYPNFSKQLKSNRQLDFSDPESIRQLTKALLHRDFDIEIDLPEDRLCPPVPNRINYIFFLQKLLDTTSPTFRDIFDQKRQVIGLDIGTGASAIYPLLGCRQRPTWRFLATEIDEKSRQYATQNIETNGLDSHIKILPTDASSKQLVPWQELERFERVDFLMTNPPFYSSRESMLESANAKSRPPFSSCTGSEVEMITSGGEVAFVGRLITESCQPRLRTKVQWYSSMLGKLSSVTSVIEELQTKGCDNYAVTEFIQGQKTRRWCVAWSWMGLRPPDHLARGISALEKRVLPFPSQYEFEVDPSPITNTPHHNKMLLIAEKIDREMKSLTGIQWQYRASLMTGIGMANDGDVWSRKARRRAQQLSQHQTLSEKGTAVAIPLRYKPDDASQVRRHHDPPPNTSATKSNIGSRSTLSESGAVTHDEDQNEDEDEAEPLLCVKITVVPLTGSDINSVARHQSDRQQSNRTAQSDEQDCPTVRVRWLQGHDSVLFESFCGWLKRRLTS